jgi:hypothetical protein
MTLEKLQLIATASASPPFKVRWLEQWNSSTHSREALHFPSKGFSRKGARIMAKPGNILGRGKHSESIYILYLKFIIRLVF